MAVLGAGQWERGGAHPLGSMSCALGGDALTPEAGWGAGYGVTPGASQPVQGCVGQDGACGADSA